AMMGWIAVSLILFLILPTRRAVIAGTIISMLFLPIHEYLFRGMIEYNKVTACSFVLLVWVVVFDWRKLATFVPGLIDLPMLCWCLIPLASSLANHETISDHYGFYDGLTSSLRQTAMWGIPYFFGRLYINDARAARDVVIGLILGGVIYIPFCLYELRFSPQLHNIVYGFHQHSWFQTQRGGGWRPTAFLDHGLMLALWMTAASMAAFWLWQGKTLRSLVWMPIWALVVPLVITSILCKSALAALMLVVGIGLFYVIKLVKSPLPLLLLILFVPTYEILRLSQVWNGNDLIVAAENLFGPDRAASLTVRLYNEDRISDRVLKAKPLLGWGTWGTYMTDEDEERENAIPDGAWVVTVGKFGIIGLICFTTAIILPAFLYLIRVPGKRSLEPDVLPVTFLAMFTSLFMIDCLMNFFVAPLYLLGIGGLASIASALVKHHARGPSFFQFITWRLLRRMHKHHDAHQ
ncbi:MAG: hypothetical protein IT440_00440, partial [Phycisphaeraceae bacterium]|nr:hypothetical protein [Phycisphaeraceae bacterium]